MKTKGQYTQYESRDQKEFPFPTTWQLLYYASRRASLLEINKIK
jgi:hypothetical protein